MERSRSRERDQQRKPWTPNGTYYVPNEFMESRQREPCQGQKSAPKLEDKYFEFSQKTYDFLEMWAKRLAQDMKKQQRTIPFLFKIYSEELAQVLGCAVDNTKIRFMISQAVELYRSGGDVNQRDLDEAMSDISQ